MNDPLSALSHWILDYFALATALLAASAFGVWRLRHPSERMAIAWGTMAGLSLLAVATALPNWPRIDVLQWMTSRFDADAKPLQEPLVKIEERVLQRAIASGDTSAEPALLPAAADEPLPACPVPTGSALGIWRWSLTLVWLAAAGMALNWIALGAVQAWRLMAMASESPPWVQTELARLVGKHKKPRLKTSTRIGSAAALGALRPAILLPAAHVHQENHDGVQAALAHEWAHIRHGDLWMLAWQRLLSPLLALHPLFWILRRQIRADQELLADFAAAGERPVEYAEALLAWAKQASQRPGAPLAALAMWENPHTVSQRIQMILDPKNRVMQTGSRWRQIVPLVALLGISVGLTAISVHPQWANGQDERSAAASIPLAGEPSADQQAIDQIKEALEKLRGEAAQNAKLREDMKRETTHLKQRVSDLMAQVAWLRSVANQDATERVPDAEFIRRVYLDLMGIVPTPDDVKSFLDSSEANKREKLLDKLLDNAKVAEHWAKTWKAAVAGDEPLRDEAKSGQAVPPPASEATISVFRLRYAAAADALKLANDLFHAVRKPKPNIAADPRSNSLIVQASSQDSQIVAAILKAIDQPAELHPASESRGPSSDRGDDHPGHDPATRRRLLEIDLQQAEAEMDLAAAELEESKKLGNVVPAAELRKKQAAVQHAQLKRERARVLLEAAAQQQKLAANSPLNRIEEGIVPPKNFKERIWQALGLKLEPAPEAAFKTSESSFRRGLAVIDVRPDSPADDRGILKGDILVGLDRWEMSSLNNVAYVLEHEDVQEVGGVSFHILRDGKVLVGRMPLTGDRVLPGALPLASKTPGTTSNEDLSIKIRLAEIDLQEAQLKLGADQLKLDRLTETLGKSPGSVAQTDLDAARLTASQSRLAVERAQTVLDGLKAKPGTANKP